MEGEGDTQRLAQLSRGRQTGKADTCQRAVSELRPGQVSAAPPGELSLCLKRDGGGWGPSVGTRGTLSWMGTQGA